MMGLEIDLRTSSFFKERTEVIAPKSQLDTVFHIKYWFFVTFGAAKYAKGLYLWTINQQFLLCNIVRYASRSPLSGLRSV